MRERRVYIIEPAQLSLPAHKRFVHVQYARKRSGHSHGIPCRHAMYCTCPHLARVQAMSANLVLQATPVGRSRPCGSMARVLQAVMQLSNCGLSWSQVMSDSHLEFEDVGPTQHKFVCYIHEFRNLCKIAKPSICCTLMLMV